MAHRLTPPLQMSFKPPARAGLTVVELMIATLLLSVIFLSAATAHVTAAKFLQSVKENQGQVFGYTAMEHMARKVRLVNAVVIEGSGATLKLRWDYHQTTFAALNTPKVFSDDSWIKYKIITLGGGAYRLDWAADDAQADDAGTIYAELQPGLVLRAGSVFSLENPTAAGAATVININLATERGIPAVPLTLNTDVLVTAQAKN